MTAWGVLALGMIALGMIAWGMIALGMIALGMIALGMITLGTTALRIKAHSLAVEQHQHQKTAADTSANTRIGKHSKRHKEAVL